MLSPHNSKETKAILNAVRALGHEPVWIRDGNLTSWIDGSGVTVSPEVDVLVNRLLLTKSDRLLEDLQLAGLYAENVPVLNSPGAVQATVHKYRAGARLARAGLPVPDAFFGRTPRAFEEWTEHLAGTAAHKQTIGTNGTRMSLVSPGEEPNPKVDNQQSFVQEFLGTDNERSADIRAYVVGTEIVGAMRRHAPEDEWRTNVALGAEVEDVTDTLGSRPRRLAREATAELGLDIAGVDLIDSDSEWYILEVNATAGFKGLFSATGVSVGPHIAKLAVERAGASVGEARIETLESTLDDSVPACKPDPGEGERANGTIGYTSRITISGTDGVEQAVAKSDTGADRTSIDTELAGRIGVGPLVGTTEVRSAAGTGTETRPIVDVKLSLNGRWRTATVSVTDRSDMNYAVLLGRDILEDYTLDVSRTVEE
ncbi:MAG: RimK/LysX family protein [Halovenus sp.]